MHSSDDISLFLFGSAAAAASAAAFTSVVLVVGIILSVVYTDSIKEEDSVISFGYEQAHIASINTQDAYTGQIKNPSPKRENIIPFASRVHEVLQMPDFPAGCEIASMTAVLQSMGYNIELPTFAQDYVLRVTGEPDGVNAYSGDPHSNGFSFPPPMVRAGNAFLREMYSPWRFVERKHMPLSRLVQVVEGGRPVLVWTTLSFEDPNEEGERIGTYTFFHSEHCVVLYGIKDSETLLIMDPLEGCIECSYERCESVYDACGRISVVISQVVTEEVDETEKLVEATNRKENK